MVKYKWLFVSNVLGPLTAVVKYKECAFIDCNTTYNTSLYKEIVSWGFLPSTLRKPKMAFDFKVMDTYLAWRVHPNFASDKSFCQFLLNKSINPKLQGTSPDFVNNFRVVAKAYWSIYIEMEIFLPYYLVLLGINIKNFFSSAKAVRKLSHMICWENDLDALLALGVLRVLEERGGLQYVSSYAAHLLIQLSICNRW